MTPEEHSKLLYLFQSLRAAPNKAKILLKMSKDRKASIQYKNYILQLKAVCDDPIKLLDLVEKIKKEMI